MTIVTSSILFQSNHQQKKIKKNQIQKFNKLNSKIKEI